jgi:tetratricopeptide (TPR) repeat protein
MRLTVCSVLLLSASSLHAQNMPFRSVSGGGTSRLTNMFAMPYDPFPLTPSEGVVQSRATSVAGAISVHQLAIPAKAAKEFQLSQKSFQVGDFQSASEHLEKAVRIFPDFPEARNNLACAYIYLKEYEKALAELRQAIAINPNLDTPHNNLSSVFFSLQRFPEAEQAARYALELNPQRTASRYDLGLAVAAQQHYTLEAVDALRQSSIEIPQARLVLALVLSRRGSADEAAAELREYLKAPDPAKKQAVQDWLSELVPTLTRSR